MDSLQCRQRSSLLCLSMETSIVDKEVGRDERSSSLAPARTFPTQQPCQIVNNRIVELKPNPSASDYI